MALAKTYSDINQKGRHMKDTENTDTNQSAQSMNSSSGDARANTGSFAGDSTPDQEPSPEKTAAPAEGSREDAEYDLGRDEGASGAGKYINLVKQKAQDYWSNHSEQFSEKFATYSDDVKLRGMLADQHVKSHTYAYLLGAAGLGFLLARVTSGKGRADLDAAVGLVNKIDFAKLAGVFGYQTEAVVSPGSEEQRRKIG